MQCYIYRALLSFVKFNCYHYEVCLRHVWTFMRTKWGYLISFEKRYKMSQYFSVPSLATLSTGRSGTLSELIIREAGPQHTAATFLISGLFYALLTRQSNYVNNIRDDYYSCMFCYNICKMYFKHVVTMSGLWATARQHNQDAFINMK